eukprot:5720188-Pyramimonas_sp.AAC.1
MERECQGLSAGCWDGVSFYRQQQDYFRIAREYALNHSAVTGSAKNMVYCETGFNSGMSALPFLLAGYEVFSFDTMKNKYSPSCALNLGICFPGKFTAIRGSSLETIAQLHREKPGLRCDVMSVDGGHSFKHVLNDISEFYKLSRPQGLVLIDDVYPMDTSGVFKGYVAATEKGYVSKPVTCYDGGEINTNRGVRHKGYCVATIMSRI